MTRLLGALRGHTLPRFRTSAASDLRVHATLVAVNALVLMLGLHHVTVYRFLANPTPTDLLWPMAWAEGLPWRTVAIGLTLAAFASGVVGVVAYRHRWARVQQAVVWVVLVAALSSFGKVNHGLHHLLIPVVVLAAVPTLEPAGRSARPVPRRAYDLVLAAQAVLLLTYSMSGVAKLWHGVQQWLAGQPGLFSTRSLAALVANRALQTGEVPPLSGFIVEHPELSALLFGATVAIELLAVATLVVPRLSVAWAGLLAGFHLAVFWSMHINFTASIAVLVVVFGLSPFVASGSARGTPAPA